MIAKTIHVLTEKEVELVSLLVRIGTTKNVARVLVYLANLKNATARCNHSGQERQLCPATSSASSIPLQQRFNGHANRRLHQSLPIAPG